MINCIYQLTSPGNINLKFQKINFENQVIVRPKYMSICHADQRYYRGRRAAAILKNKLPMALIHECCGEVLKDFSNSFSPGTKVVLIPNVLSSVSKDEIYENYQKGSGFRSSGLDGFMQEIVSMDPNRVVPFNDFYNNEYIFSISELVSVAIHSVKRFLKISHKNRGKIAVFGDGNLGYLTSLVINKLIPNSEIIVVGKHQEKLAHFSFVSECYIDIPDGLEFDHAFECTGGLGSVDAIDKIIKYINPQGSVILMGVSEDKIPINTRNILEKGLTFVGCSRSGLSDFVDAVKMLECEKFNRRVSNLITFEDSVSSISDIHMMFKKVMQIPFKLVFKWNL